MLTSPLMLQTAKYKNQHIIGLKARRVCACIYIALDGGTKWKIRGVRLKNISRHWLKQTQEQQP